MQTRSPIATPDERATLARLRAVVDATPGFEAAARGPRLNGRSVTAIVRDPPRGSVEILRTSNFRSLLFTWDPHRRRLRTRLHEAEHRISSGDFVRDAVDLVRKRGRRLSDSDWISLRFLFSERKEVSDEVGHLARTVGVIAAGPVLYEGVEWFERFSVHEAALVLWDSVGVDHAALCREIGGGHCPLDLARLHALASLGDVTRPTWVSQGMARAPVLRHAFDDGHVDMGLRRRIGAELSRGMPPDAVATRALAVTFPDAVRTVRGLAPTAFRSLSRVDAGGFPWSSGEDRHLNVSGKVGNLATFLGCYHADRPRRAPLTAEEVRRVVDALRIWSAHLSRDDPWGDGRRRTDHETMAGLLLVRGAAARLGTSLTRRDGVLVGLPSDAQDVITAVDAAVGGMVGLCVTGLVRRDRDALARLIADDVLFPVGRSAEAWARHAATWHAAAVGLRDRELAVLGTTRSGDAGHGPYAHLSDGPEVVDGVTLTPLLTSGDFVREGREMRHCIGGYGPRAARGEVLAWSLSGPDDERSTASVEVGRDGGLVVAQHRAAENGPPYAHHAAVLSGFVRTLAGRTHALVRLEAVRASRGRSPVTAEPAPLDHEARRELLDVWSATVSPMLSPSARRSGPEVWVASVAGPALRLVDELRAAVPRGTVRERVARAGRLAPGRIVGRARALAATHRS